MALPSPSGRLSVEGVSYGLPGRKPVLRGVTFSVEPGQAVAIIGPSAAGKSTLARLLVGVARPAAGQVRLDGADLFLWPRQDIGRHIGYLPQDVELFDGTIRDNIARLGEAEPSEIVAAARMAYCHEMVLRLDQGYETPIGEQGVRLSGGQRQRIALARALFGSPRLVVLDEPNANLDGDGEVALNRAISALKKTGAAVIVIGHRPSLLQEVDKVLLLVDGQVEKFGPRAEVIDQLTRRSIKTVAPAVASAGAPSRQPPGEAPATHPAAGAIVPPSETRVVP
jgi:ABC-type protease/lipase transport system fused ATPase/permease subunit